ncbi:unnamed protein product [Absidia cylindrospora]
MPFIVDLPQEALPSLLGLLKLTYTRYQDRASRQAILDVYKELNAWNSTLFQKTLVPVLSREAEKICKRSASGQCVTPASDRFVLLTWMNAMTTFILEAATSAEDDKTTTTLLGLSVNGQGLLIDSLGDDSTKRSLWHSSVSHVRRSFRNQATHIPRLFDTALTNPSNAVLIGILIDVSLHLKRVDGKALYLTTTTREPQLIDYYLKNIISSRTPLRHAAMVAFGGFIHAIVDEAKFRAQFLPVLEKMMLRSPEIALQALAAIIPSFSFDPSSLFASHLVDPVSNHLRSTSAAVRQGAMTLWRALATASVTISDLINITQHVTTPLKQGKISTPEHRICLYQALAELAQHNDAHLSDCVLTNGYLTVLLGNKKEANEQAMVQAIQGCGKHVAVVLYNDVYCQEHSTLINDVIKVMTDGLVSPKATLRTQWAYVVGTTYWQHQQPTVTLADQALKYLTPLFATTTKIQAKPLAWKDGPLEGYVLVALLSGRIQSTWTSIPTGVADLIKKNNYPASLIPSNGSANSFLLMDRVYMKAVSEEEGVWFTHALISVLMQLDLSSSEQANQVGQAIVWMLTSHPVHTVRRLVYQGVAAASQLQPQKLASVMPRALTCWLMDLEKETRGSVAVVAASNVADSTDPLVSHYRLASALGAMTSFASQVSTEIKESILVELIILAHHSLIVSPTDKYNWITLVQRAGLNPGALVKSHARRLKELVTSTLMTDSKDSKLFYEAALAAISTLSFIDASSFASFADHTKLLDPSLMTGIGDLEYNIWQTPEGTNFVDVLKKKSDRLESRGRKTKDQEWEDELRAELAAKNKTQRKLTKEEQVAVNGQQRKEADVRAKVQGVYDQINVGLDILGALFTQNGSQQEKEDNGMVLEAMQALLAMAKSNAGILVQDKLVDTYLGLGRTQHELDGALADAICLATLRCNQVKDIPARWLDEPLVDLMNRILYKLRFLTESRPLSASAFAFCFPALYQVIKQGGIPKTSDMAMEQVALALDIVGFHTSLVGTTCWIPRQDLIECLLYSIREYPGHGKATKTSLVTLCSAMDGTTISTQEYDALFHGLLSDDPTVRLAALQGLEVNIFYYFWFDKVVLIVLVFACGE